MNSNNVTEPMVNEELNCSLITEVPWAQDLFRHELAWNVSILAGAAFLSAITIAIFIEECIFIKKNFPPISTGKTVLILGMYPVLSLTSVVGCLVPRAGSIIDVVGHMFLSKSLCQFVPLTIYYFGGPQQIWTSIGRVDVPMKPFSTCCCYLRLPRVPFDKTFYGRVHLLVAQFSILRPILMIVTAVIQINGSYLPMMIQDDNAFVYILVIDLVSTFIGVYGLQLIKDALIQVSDLRQTQLKGKFLNMQLMMILTVILRLVMGILVSTDNIRCGPMVPTYTRGDRIYHAAIVLFMLPMAVWGRFLYRTTQEIVLYRQQALPKLKSTGLMTSTKELSDDTDEGIEDVGSIEDITEETALHNGTIYPA